MKTFLIFLLVVSGLFLIDLDIGADMIRMKNGKVVEGKFLGGTEYVIHFQTDNKVAIYQVEDILTITFMPTSSQSLQRAPVSPTPKIQTPQPEQQEIIIKRHTRLSVRMVNSLNTGMSRKGDWFDTMLTSDLVVDGVVVVPKGTTIRGQVVKSEQGSSSSVLVIALRKLLLRQEVIPISTTTYGMWDRVPEGSDAVKSYRKGRLLQIPPQTILEFKTTKPITIDLSK
jgi:hypothetical protein